MTGNRAVPLASHGHIHTFSGQLYALIHPLPSLHNCNRTSCEIWEAFSHAVSSTRRGRAQERAP